MDRFSFLHLTVFSKRRIGRGDLNLSTPSSFSRGDFSVKPTNWKLIFYLSDKLACFRFTLINAAHPGVYFDSIMYEDSRMWARIVDTRSCLLVHAWNRSRPIASRALSHVGLREGCAHSLPTRAVWPPRAVNRTLLHSRRSFCMANGASP